MMSRNFYIGITIVLFILAYIPDLINTILFSILSTETIDFTMIPENRLKLILLFLICIMESSLIKKQYPGIIGWMLTFALFCGYTMYIMHWPNAKEIMYLTTGLILLNLIAFAVIEKNKNFFHYLLFAFIAFRVIGLPMLNNKLIWWLDLILGNLIAVIGIFYSIKILKASRLEN